MELSGKGKMKSIVSRLLSPQNRIRSDGAFAYGEVELEEGACFNAVVKGITKRREERSWKTTNFRCLYTLRHSRETAIRR